jgi:hypothetical protein
MISMSFVETSRSAPEVTRFFTMVNGFTFTASGKQQTRKKFLERFDGERFDPMERGRGSNWARWKNPSAGHCAQKFICVIWSNSCSLPGVDELLNAPMVKVAIRTKPTMVATKYFAMAPLSRSTFATYE